MILISVLLKDKDDGVRQTPGSSLARFGKKAESALPTLRELPSTKNANLEAAAEKAIKEIRQAKDATAAEREHREMLKNISQLLNSRR